MVIDIVCVAVSEYVAEVDLDSVISFDTDLVPEGLVVAESSFVSESVSDELTDKVRLAVAVSLPDLDRDC